MPERFPQMSAYFMGTIDAEEIFSPRMMKTSL